MCVYYVCVYTQSSKLVSLIPKSISLEALQNLKPSSLVIALHCYQWLGVEVLELHNGSTSWLVVIGLGLFGSFGNDLRGFDYRFWFAMGNLVASTVSVAIIVLRNGGNCFSGFQAMCEFTPMIDDGFTLRFQWRRKRGEL